MDFTETLKQMLAAARKAAGAHWEDVRGYLEQELATAQKDARLLALQVANGVKTPEQARIELESIELSLKDVRLELRLEGKAAAQEAINAALDVLRGAVNSAAKVTIF